MKRILIGIGAFILSAVILLGVTSIFFPPVLEKPALTGKYIVGFLETTITDPSRTMQQNQPRVISLDVWYPASGISNKLEPYDTATLRSLLQKIQNIPNIGGDTPSRSYRDAPALKGKHKVILFNHGFASFTKQNFSNMEEMAGHGYIVISIGHPEDSLVARDVDGAIIELNTESTVYQQLKAIEKRSQISIKQLEGLLTTQRHTSTLEQHKTASRALRQHEQYAALAPQLETWVTDTRFVMQSLQKGINALPFADANWVVISGHSLGGMVALEIGQTSSAGLRGIISLDAPWIGTTLAVPALVMVSTEFTVGGSDLSLHGTFDQPLRSGKGAYLLEPKGAAHMNFTDLNYVPVIKLFSPILGSIDGKRMGNILNTALLEYLRQLEQKPDFTKNLLPTQDDVRQVVFAANK